MDTPGTRNSKLKTQNSKPAQRSGAIWWWIAGIILALLIIPPLLTGLATDWMWFASQDLAGVYTTRLWLGVGVFFGAGLLAALFCWVNWSLASRLSLPNSIFPGQRQPIPRGLVRAVIIGVALAVGLFLGLTAADEWPTILLFVNGVPFDQTDPIFNNDIGFYVFGLPFYQLIRGWSLALLVISAIGVAVVYLSASGISQITRQVEARDRDRQPSRGNAAPDFRLNLDSHMGAHLSILGAIFLLLVAVGYWLQQFDLLFSSRAVAYGAGYTDVNAKLPSLYILMVITALAALLLLANIWVRTWKLLLGAFGVWLLALVLVGGVYPWFVQQFQVRPNEQSLELPYIRNNIAATRRAFGLDKFKEREVPAVSTLTAQQLEQDRSVVDDIRLWDYRPLLITFGQLQQIRSYYTFNNVDIDRYVIDGRIRQLMLAARELTTDGLSAQAQTWQNLHLVYTHGYGVVASPVNEIEGEGFPRLLVKNVPPETDAPALKMTRPEIYYGEKTDSYLFVNSGTPEFDYPLGDSNQTTTYAGKGGVALSGLLTKLLFALRFGDGNVLLSESITPQTRVLFHRNIGDAVNLLAPFLKYDKDPYIVVSDGKLYWIWDAYTTTDSYPYSTPFRDISGDDRNIVKGSFNYIRNSVKVAISAYDGSATFYVADPTDPIVRAYRGIFPALFKDFSAMPADLRRHIRYPEALMNVQADVYNIFHMTDPLVFYSKEDEWTVPRGTHSDTSAPLEAYYTLLRLPGQDKDSFRLILPFTPKTRNNMIAWMAASSDPDTYGQVDVIRYPKQQLVFGPQQIEARIDQDPTISQQLSLWNQSGSKVLRANLLTIPISNSVLYVEPLFLQATASGTLPELKRVIVATGERVGFGVDLKSALDVALNRAAPPPPTGGGSPGPNPTPAPGTTPAATPALRTPAELTRSALQHYNNAQDALKRSDWTTYGREIEAMKSDLDQLALLTGAAPAIPSPSPGASPTP